MTSKPKQRAITSTEVDDNRARVLTAIRGAASPMTVETLASELVLHPNTVRFHTRALIDEGLIEQHSERTGGKGRPRAIFRATELGARSGERNFELLSKILVEHVAGQVADPVRVATAAGRSWGATLRDEAPGSLSGVQAVTAFLDEMGFEPVSQAPAAPGEVHLFNCPFRELADAHEDVVCAVHRGLLEGMVDDNVTLEPFTTPAICTVRVTEPDDH